MFCTRCGAANINNARYCQECGNPLNGEDCTEKDKITDKDEKFNILMRNSGFFTIGLGVLVSLFGLSSGLITILFGALLILVKRVGLLAIIGAILLLTGFFNILFGRYFGLIQVLMATTFFYSFYKYSR
jgi:hypothetical protein